MVVRLVGTQFIVSTPAARGHNELCPYKSPPIINMTINHFYIRKLS